METHAMRRDYQVGQLRRADLAPEPREQFERWFRDVQAETGVADGIEVNAMTLATVDAAGRPHARIVLLKDCDERGFRFFTNYESDKGLEIATHAEVSLVFHWQALERQVRIEGAADKLPRAESEAYFQSRPLASRLGAWASPQSRVLGGREELEAAYAEAVKRFGDGPVPMPPNWGGYVVRPERAEFWQGRRSRLHDRFCYTRGLDGTWGIERLAP